MGKEEEGKMGLVISVHYIEYSPFSSLCSPGSDTVSIDRNRIFFKMKMGSNKIVLSSNKRQI